MRRGRTRLEKFNAVTRHPTASTAASTRVDCTRTDHVRRRGPHVGLGDRENSALHCPTGLTRATRPTTRTVSGPPTMRMNGRETMRRAREGVASARLLECGETPGRAAWNSIPRSRSQVFALPSRGPR